MKPDTVIARTTLSGLTGLRNVYTSAMAAAGSAASSALSLWSDALIHRGTPSAAAVASSTPKAITRPRDRGAVKRSMVHPSWKKRTGAELHRLYARPDNSDCRALAALPGSNEERLLRSEEHTSELQSLAYLVCRLLLEKKKNNQLSQTRTDKRS